MNYITDKIINSEICVSPFPHLFIENFFNDEDATHLNDFYEKNKQNLEYHYESYWWRVETDDLTGRIKSIIDTFLSMDFVNLIYKKFNVTNPIHLHNDCFEFDLKYDDESCQTQNFWHTDREYVIRAQFCLNDKDYNDGGTAFVGKENPLKFNSMQIFPTTKQSLHRVYQRNYQRKHMMFSYCHPDFASDIEIEDRKFEDKHYLKLKVE